MAKQYALQVGIALLELTPGAFRAVLPRSWRQRWVRRQLNAQWGGALSAFLQDSSRAHRAWMHASLADVRRSFRAIAASLTLQIEVRAHRPTRTDTQAAVSDLRRLRQFDAENPPS